MLQAATTSPTSVTGGDAYGTRAMQALSEGDVKKAQEIQKEDDTRAAAIMGTAAIIPETAVTGVVPTLVTTTAGLGGGYIGNKVGTYADEKFGTKWIAPVLSIIGGAGSGIGAYKGLVNAGTKGLLKGNNIMYSKDFIKDVVNNFADNNLKQLSINGPLRHYTRYTTMHPDYDDILSETNLYDTLTGKNIAQSSTFKNNHFDVSRIENIVGENGVKGKSRDLYSSELLENMEGVISGTTLLQPHKTIPTWKHFKHKIVGYFGDHGLEEINNGPVALLQYPERYIPNVESKIQLAFPIMKHRNKKVYWTMHPEQPSTYFKDAKYPTSSKSYNGKEVPAWQLPKGERNQPVKPEYKDLRFIRNLDGLPDMENGIVLASPKKQLLANFTTDVPFRLHQNYKYAPGAEYMLVDPAAFKGVKPLTIDPMDTIFINSDLQITPNYVTMLSGNADVLAKAQQKGMKIATSDKLQKIYKDWMVDPKSESLSKAYRDAVDEFITDLGRPTYQVYHDLQKRTGLQANTTWGAKSFVDELKRRMKLPLPVQQSPMSWPNGGPVSLLYLHKWPANFKHVVYDPYPPAEGDLLLKMGGFSKLHPEVTDAPELLHKLLREYQEGVGALKKGGKLHNNLTK